jgi:hypothetical protein
VQIQDAKVIFISVPDANPSNTTVHEVKNHVRQTILSGQTNLSLRVPMVATSFSASFLPANEENSTAINTHRRAYIQKMNDLQYLFNNNTMELITYNMDDQREILRHYLMSMKSAKNNQLLPASNNADSGYGIGLAFTPLDLTKNSFNVNMEAAEFNDTNYILYSYFKGIAEL